MLHQATYHLSCSSQKQILAISPDTLHTYRLLLYRCSVITSTDLFLNQNKDNTSFSTVNWTAAMDVCGSNAIYDWKFNHNNPFLEFLEFQNGSGVYWTVTERCYQECPLKENDSAFYYTSNGLCIKIGGNDTLNLNLVRRHWEALVHQNCHTFATVQEL